MKYAGRLVLKILMDVYDNVYETFWMQSISKLTCAYAQALSALACERWGENMPLHIILSWLGRDYTARIHLKKEDSQGSAVQCAH